MTSRPRILSALALCLLTACQSVPVPAPDLGSITEPDIVLTTTKGPPGAAPGTCWGRDVSPATIETVTEHVLVQPAEVMADGTVTAQAIYRTETRQQIVKERRETWFQTPCPEVLTPEFVASLQRALAVRKHYWGSISGEMDSRTRAAVRRYQKEGGLDSGILSLETARQLGLVVTEIE